MWSARFEFKGEMCIETNKGGGIKYNWLMHFFKRSQTARTNKKMGNKRCACLQLNHGYPKQNLIRLIVCHTNNTIDLVQSSNHDWKGSLYDPVSN
jgi:hypothetical protein